MWPQREHVRNGGCGNLISLDVLQPPGMNCLSPSVDSVRGYIKVSPPTPKETNHACLIGLSSGIKFRIGGLLGCGWFSAYEIQHEARETPSEFFLLPPRCYQTQ